jgi:hypothetical protein
MYKQHSHSLTELWEFVNLSRKFGLHKSSRKDLYRRVSKLDESSYRCELVYHVCCLQVIYRFRTVRTGEFHSSLLWKGPKLEPNDLLERNCDWLVFYFRILLYDVKEAAQPWWLFSGYIFKTAAQECQAKLPSTVPGGLLLVLQCLPDPETVFLLVGTR